METKAYSVVLTKQGANELATTLSLWLRQIRGESYLNCRSFDSNGPYFVMKLPDGDADKSIEIQIPHGFVKCVVYSADCRQLGFV